MELLQTEGDCSFMLQIYAEKSPHLCYEYAAPPKYLQSGNAACGHSCLFWEQLAMLWREVHKRTLAAATFHWHSL